MTTALVVETSVTVNNTPNSRKKISHLLMTLVMADKRVGLKLPDHLLKGFDILRYLSMVFIAQFISFTIKVESILCLFVLIIHKVGRIVSRYNLWLATLKLQPTNVLLNTQVVFEGLAGTGYMGDIALDDVMVFKDSNCGLNPSSAQPSSPQPTPIPTPPSKLHCWLKFFSVFAWCNVTVMWSFNRYAPYPLTSILYVSCIKLNVLKIF